MGNTAVPGLGSLFTGLRRNESPNDEANYTGIVIPTVLQMFADAVSFWTNLTCLYDPHHVVDLPLPGHF